jgi:hypothetical protein
MSSSSGGKQTQYMALYAQINVNGPKGSRNKKIKLVEGIEGKAAGEAMERTLIAALLENNNSLKGELEAL